MQTQPGIPALMWEVIAPKRKPNPLICSVCHKKMVLSPLDGPALYWDCSRCKREISLLDAIVPAFRMAEQKIEHEHPVAVTLNFNGRSDSNIIQIASTERTGITRAERKAVILPQDYKIDVLDKLITEIENMLQVNTVEVNDLFQND